jgi:HSP20 family protein
MGSRTFTRTVWLPYPVNATGVKAKLEDGILTVQAPKAAQESVDVTVE